MKRPLIIDRRKSGLRIRDVFFARPDDCPPTAGADLCYFLQAQAPVADADPFYTSLIDLAQDEAALLDGINKGFRYEIRRARDKDLLQAQLAQPDAATLDRFYAYYDAFAGSRALAGANRAKLSALQAAGALVLAWMPDVRESAGPEAPWLSAHLYIVDGERTRLYHSASPVSLPASDRQLIGRANKLLHWEALLHFKAAGCRTYDLGGLSMGDALKAIDDFKRSFGGVVVKEFNHIEATSIKGRLALLAWRLKARLAARRLGGNGGKAASE
jgi:hypothetical protein